MDRSTRSSRRRFLTVCGSVATGVLAGCTGTDDRTGTDPSPDGDESSTGTGRPGETDTENTDTDSEPEVVTITGDGDWPMPGYEPGQNTYLADRGGPKGELEPLWTHELERLSIGVAVNDGTVYLGEASATYRALDLLTGEVLWEELIDDGWRGTNPVVTDEALYVGAKNLVALDPNSGDQLWTSDAINPNSLAYASDQLFVHYGEGSGWDTDAHVAAFDPENRTVQWRGGTPGEQFSIGSVDDGRLYLRDASGNLVAYDTTTGQEAWSTKYSDGGSLRSVTATNGRVYVEYMNGSYNGVVDVYDGASGDVAWTYKNKSSGHRGTPTVTDDVMYITADGGGPLEKIDTGSGEQRQWEADVDEYGLGRPYVTDDAVYVAVRNAIKGFDRESGETVASYRPQGSSLGAPLILDDIMLVTGQTKDGGKWVLRAVAPAGAQRP